MEKEREIEEVIEPQWKKIGRKVVGALKLMFKTIWEFLKAVNKLWWNYIDAIATADPKDFDSNGKYIGNKTKEIETESDKKNHTSKNLKTTVIDGQVYYKDKKGNFKRLDI